MAFGPTDMREWMRNITKRMAVLERRTGITPAQLESALEGAGGVDPAELEAQIAAGINSTLPTSLEALGPMPTGSIMAWGMSAPPAGWLLCQGQSVSRTTYASLFAIIGTAYGSVAADTFRLPDLTGRVPAGLSPTSPAFDTLGEKGGAETHTLTTAEIPSHKHPTHVATGTLFGAAGGTYSAAVTGTPQYDNGGLAGGGGAHNNLQPYLVLNFIIKHTMQASTAAESQVVQRMNVFETKELGGTTTTRNAVWGTPSTAAERLALHNQHVQWWRSDKGWTEQYFAAVADGATKANGAVTVAGWYPISGKLPYTEIVQTTTAYNYPTSNTRIAMDAVSLQIGTEITSNLGSAVTSGQLVTGLAGRYEYNLHLLMSTGTATYIDLYVRKNGVDLTAITASIPNAGFWAEVSETRPNVLAASTDYFQMFITAGAAYTMQSRTQGTRFGMQYTSPPFVS